MEQISDGGFVVDEVERSRYLCLLLAGRKQRSEGGLELERRETSIFIV